MTKIMNKFNVAKYNEKINTLNKIIDTFNDTISNFFLLDGYYTCISKGVDIQSG